MSPVSAPRSTPIAACQTRIRQAYQLTPVVTPCYERHALPSFTHGAFAMTASDPHARPEGSSAPTGVSTNAPATREERTFQAFSTSSVGLEMGASVLIGIAIGYYLDQEFATAPYLTLLFLGFGVAAGFRALFRVARQAKRMYGESNEQKPNP